MAEIKNFRHGHRERVRARFLREGLSRFADYEVLELLLFYAIPRRDTKEQAHALDDLLGSLHATLTASEDALCRVAGIGARTAKFLRSIYSFMRYVAREETHLDACFDQKELAERVYPYLERGDVDSSVLLLLNNRDEIIHAHPLGEGIALTQISLEDVVTLAFTYRASTVIFADYKARGIPFPDDIVLQGSQTLNDDLGSVGIHLRDYLLFTKSQYNSLFHLKNENQLRAASPFFLVGNRTRARGSERSILWLAEILSFVMPVDKAEPLARELLTQYSSLATLLSLPYSTLAKEYPDAEAQLLYLKIVADVYARTGFSHARARKGVPFTNATMLGELFVDMLGTHEDENLAIAMFDENLRLIDVELCSEGTVNAAPVVMRLLVETAVSHKAAYVAVAHNHPCGVVIPSVVDTGLTGSIYKNLHRVNIKFIDHFVVTSSEALPLSRRFGISRYADLDDSFYST